MVSHFLIFNDLDFPAVFTVMDEVNSRRRGGNRIPQDGEKKLNIIIVGLISAEI